MTPPETFVTPEGRRIAYRFDAGASDDVPVIVWLSGFLSDMASTKVVFLSECFQHQVLPTGRARSSITSWFSRRPLQCL